MARECSFILAKLAKLIRRIEWLGYCVANMNYLGLD